MSLLLSPAEINQWHGYLTEKNEQQRRARKKAARGRGTSGGYSKR